MDGNAREAVKRRLLAYRADDDTAVAGPDALLDVAALLTGIPADADEDAVREAFRLAGLLFWCRNHLPDSVDDDLTAAMALLAPVWQADPNRVPPAVAAHFAVFGLGSFPQADAWHAPARVLADYARQTPDPEPSVAVVDLLRRAAAAATADDPSRGRLLSNLAMAVQRRYERTGTAADLEEAIEVGRRALAGFAADDPDRVVPLAALAVALRRRSGSWGGLLDLDEAIDLGRAAVAATAPDDPAWADRSGNLAVALGHHASASGSAVTAADAVAIWRQVLGATASTDHRRVGWLVNLAAALYVRFETTGAVADLDDALACADAAAAQPMPDDLTHAALLTNRCDLLRARFRFTGRSLDLDAAVAAGSAALTLLPRTHPDRAGAHANLGLALHARHQRTQAVSDREAAVRECHNAVGATPAGHADLPGRLSNLADALLGSAEDASRPGADLDAAVAAAEQAVEAATGHPRHALYLSNLGNALRARHEHGGAASDLDRSIDAGRLAVDTCPPGSVFRAACLANVAVALRLRDHTGDLHRAIDFSREAALHTVGALEVRVRSAARWGTWAAEHGDWTEGAVGLGAAVALLTRVAPRELPRGDQEFELARLGGLGSNAAACALNAGATAAAVRLLEQGRGILLAHTLISSDEPATGTGRNHLGPIATPPDERPGEPRPLGK